MESVVKPSVIKDGTNSVLIVSHTFPSELGDEQVCSHTLIHPH